MMKEKLNIIHVDMDAFFASVEQLDNPKLKGKPVIIGGIALDNRGVVSTASYQARKFGIHSAMPIAEAKRLCPQGIYLPARSKRYSEISKQIFNIFKEFTPQVEKLSIDEAFLNVKGCHRLYGSSEQIAKKIKKTIKKKIGINCSIGVANNKFLAKIGSDLDKPDGLVIIENDKISDIIDPLSIKKIPGIGKKSAKKLNEIGISKIEQLKNLSIKELESLFGKNGKNLFDLIRGKDLRKVTTKQKMKSISNEITFDKDVNDKDILYKYLLKLCQKVTRRLRKDKVTGNIIFLKLKNDQFKVYTKRITVKVYINSTD
ncbi:MAG: DNA polymerase IV, partial [Halanaerobiales bacterium]|nr:DNA polymerase IV [Halanaerobiales bacterium]